VLFLTHREPAPGEDRGSELVASRGEGSAETLRPLSKEEQPASDARLQWTPVAGAVRYRVQVSTEDLRPIHDRTLEGTTLALPAELGKLGSAGVTPEAPQSGQVYLWQVEALLPDGRSVTSSTFRLRLVPASPRAPR